MEKTTPISYADKLKQGANSSTQKQVKQKEVNSFERPLSDEEITEKWNNSEYFDFVKVLKSFSENKN